MIDNCFDLKYDKIMIRNSPFYTSVLFLLLFLGLISSCALDYKEGQVEEEISGETPNAILYNLKRVNIDSSGEKIVVTAKTSTFFREAEETLFEDVEFYQEDKSHTLLRKGTIGSGTLMKGDDAELKNGIYLFDKENDAVIEAEQLFWIDATRILKTDGFVTVSQEDGTKIEGKGLFIDFSTNSINMDSHVEGVIITEEE